VIFQSKLDLNQEFKNLLNETNLLQTITNLGPSSNIYVSDGIQFNEVYYLKNEFIWNNEQRKIGTPCDYNSKFPLRRNFFNKILNASFVEPWSFKVSIYY
jgi:hypothetical protein